MPYGTVNGAKLHYHVTGRGIPLIFVHPPLLNQQIFNYQKAQLADSFNIITFDIRGHGLSPYSEAPVTYTLIAEDMRQLLHDLGIRQAVACGYSTGGGVALQAMLTYPDVFIGGVMISAMPEVSDWFLSARIRLAEGISRLKGKRLLGGAVGWGNADMSLTFQNLYKGAIEGDIRNIRQYYSASRSFSCTDRLPGVKQPVLLLYGKEDTSFHRYARLMDEKLPDSTLVYVEGAGHQLPTKAPRTCNRLMEEWVRRHFGGGEVREAADYMGDHAQEHELGKEADHLSY